jgi:hypothetical protein
MSDPDRIARAEARRGRAVLRKARLTAEEVDLSPIDGAGAISLVARLSRESFSLTGQAEPTYTRAETPYKFVRGRLT